MTEREAVAEVRAIAKRCGYEGKLTEDALEACASVYLSHLNTDGEPRPKTYRRAPNRKASKLNEIQWLLVNTSAFKRWFGKSVVTDENGDPRPMYHGSTHEFSSFSPSAIKLSKAQMTMWSGPGFYFTDAKRVADIYAKGGPVKEVYLRLENPLEVDETGEAVRGTGRITRKMAEEVMLKGDNTQWLDTTSAAELARMDDADGLKGIGKAGYRALSREARIHRFVARLKTDVVRLKCIASAYGAKSQRKMLHNICAVTGHDGVIHHIAPDVTEWVVYKPEAIKSATGNDGGFSRHNASTMDSSVSEGITGGTSDMAFGNLVGALTRFVGKTGMDKAIGMDIVDRNGRHHQPKAIPEGGQYEEEGQYLTGNAKLEHAVRAAGEGKRGNMLREKVAPLYAKMGVDSRTRASIQAMHENIRGLSKHALMRGMVRHMKEMKRHAANYEAVKEMDKEQFAAWLSEHPEYNTDMTQRLMNESRYNHQFGVKGGYHDDGTGHQKHEAWEEAKWGVGARAVASMILFQEHSDALNGAPDNIMANEIEHAQNEQVNAPVENREEPQEVPAPEPQPQVPEHAEEVPQENIVATPQQVENDAPAREPEATTTANTRSHVVLVQNGDKVGISGQDAVRAASVLGVELDNRNGTPYCEFPSSQQDVFHAKLIRAGIPFAYGESSEEPARNGDTPTNASSPDDGDRNRYAMMYGNGGNGGTHRIEVATGRGVNQTSVSGLSSDDANAMASRIRTALRSSGLGDVGNFEANIAGADRVTNPRSLDLPVALAALKSAGHMNNEQLSEYAAIGELGMSGEVAHNASTANDIRNAVAEAKRIGKRGILVPYEAIDIAARNAQGIDVIPVRTLREAQSFLNGETQIEPRVIQGENEEHAAPRELSRSDYTDAASILQRSGNANGVTRHRLRGLIEAIERGDVDRSENAEEDDIAEANRLIENLPEGNPVRDRLSTAVANYNRQVGVTSSNEPTTHEAPTQPVESAPSAQAPAENTAQVRDGGFGNIHYTQEMANRGVNLHSLIEASNLLTEGSTITNRAARGFIESAINDPHSSLAAHVIEQLGEGYPITNYLLEERGETDSPLYTGSRRQSAEPTAPQPAATTYTDREGNTHTVEHNEGGLKAQIHPSEIGAVQAEMRKAFADANNDVEGAEEYAHALSHFLGRGGDERSPHHGMRQEGMMKYQLADKMQTRLEAKRQAVENATTDEARQEAERDLAATSRAIRTIARTLGITGADLPEGVNYTAVRDVLGYAPRMTNPEHQPLADALHAIANPEAHEEMQRNERPHVAPAMSASDATERARQAMREAGLQGEPQMFDNGETNEIGEHWFNLGFNGDHTLQMVVKPNGDIFYGVNGHEIWGNESSSLADTLRSAREDGITFGSTEQPAATGGVQETITQNNEPEAPAAAPAARNNESDVDAMRRALTANGIDTDPAILLGYLNNGDIGLLPSGMYSALSTTLGADHPLTQRMAQLVDQRNATESTTSQPVTAAPSAHTRNVGRPLEAGSPLMTSADGTSSLATDHPLRSFEFTPEVMGRGMRGLTMPRNFTSAQELTGERLAAVAGNLPMRGIFDHNNGSVDIRVGTRFTRHIPGGQAIRAMLTDPQSPLGSAMLNRLRNYQRNHQGSSSSASTRAVNRILQAVNLLHPNLAQNAQGASATATATPATPATPTNGSATAMPTATPTEPTDEDIRNAAHRLNQLYPNAVVSESYMRSVIEDLRSVIEDFRNGQFDRLTSAAMLLGEDNPIVRYGRSLQQQGTTSGGNRQQTAQPTPPPANIPSGKRNWSDSRNTTRQGVAEYWKEEEEKPQARAIYDARKAAGDTDDIEDAFAKMGVYRPAEPVHELTTVHAGNTCWSAAIASFCRHAFGMPFDTIKRHPGDAERSLVPQAHAAAFRNASDYAFSKQVFNDKMRAAPVGTLAMVTCGCHYFMIKKDGANLYTAYDSYSGFQNSNSFPSSARSEYGAPIFPEIDDERAARLGRGYLRHIQEGTFLPPDIDPRSVTASIRGNGARIIYPDKFKDVDVKWFGGIPKGRPLTEADFR